MHVLIIGAGAVGVVYARHVQQGGARVTLLVKPKYAAAARQGFVLYPLNRRRRRDPVRWQADAVIADVRELNVRPVDVVLPAVSSTALRGDWLAPTLAACPEALVVLLQAGPEDREVLCRHVPEERLAQGGLTLISYAAPLPGETRFPTPGTAYWFPPLSPAPFDGDDPRLPELIDTLRRGGLPAAHRPGFPDAFRFAAALTSPCFAGLEAAGWSFAALRRGDGLDRTAAAVRETLAIVGADARDRVPAWARAAARPLALGALTRLSALAPLDMETYLRVHFTKVGDQTRLYLDQYIARGEVLGLSTDALGELRAAIGAVAAAA